MELYIHIPYCKQKCRYCDFLSFKDHSSMEAYFRKLKEELTYYGRKLEHPPVETIFIGGGTPSIVEGAWIRELMQVVHTNYNVADRAEITIEANPATFDLTKARNWKIAGINRVSMGVQSFDDELLRTLGRIHNAEAARLGFRILREAGFTNISMDLMMGLPGQTVEQWKETLSEAISLGPEHLSCYSLIVEEGTPFYELYEKDLLILPEEEEERLMYHETLRILREAGYHQYEISNFAKPYDESEHNKGYWTGASYLGAGLGAASYLNAIRYRNTETMSIYLSKEFDEIRQVEEVLTTEEQKKERMMLGFRMTEGVSKETYVREFHEEPKLQFEEKLKKLTQQGLIEETEEAYRLTEKGKDLGNLVFAEFI